MTSSSPNKIEQPKTSPKAVEWALIALLFVGVSLTQAWLDRQDLYINVGTDPFYHLTFIKSFLNPTLYQADPVFHQTFYAAHAFDAYPVCLYLLNMATIAFSFLGALGFFQVIFSILYLGSATFFLYKFSGRPWISALVTLISARQIAVFPSEQWGVLSAALITPSTFFLIFAPLLFWAWLTFQDHPLKKRGLFLAQGVIGTLHPLSCYTMTLSMLFAQLVHGRFKRSAIIDSTICGLLALLPMIPFILTFASAKKLSTLPVGDYQAAREAIYGIFPSLRIETITFGWFQALLMDFGWIMLTLWALASVRQRIPKLAFCFSGGCILLFLASYALNEWVLIPREMLLFLDGNRTLKFLLLPAMLIITLWLSERKSTALLLRSATVLFFLVVFNASQLWSDTQKQPFAATRLFFNQWAAFNASRHPLEYLERQKIYDTSAWLKQNLKPADTLIFVSYPNRVVNFMVRALGEKSVAYAWSDGSIVYQADPKQFITWVRQTAIIDHLHATENYCSLSEINYAKQLKATHILCPTWRTPPGMQILYQNEMATILKI